MKRYGQMRTFRITAVVALCVVGGALAGGLACSSSSQDGADQSKGGESARASTDLVAQVNEILQLRSSSVITLDVDATPGLAASVNLPIAGEQYTLDLHPQSVRAANYQVKVQLADGSLVEVEPGPVRTLRGTVVGVEGSAVAASMEEDGLHARIFLSDGEQYWVEPVASRVPRAGPNHYVVYHNDDIIAPEKACGLDHLPDALGNRGVLGTVRQTRAGACGTGLCVAELAADADFEYYLAYNSSVPAVESRINSVINAVNIQYERDVDITQVISAIIVRIAEPDPYSVTDAVALLFQFRDHWIANHGNIQRDMAQLFTGKELDSNIIGVAWLNAVCGSFGYSLVQSDFNNNFGCTTDLTAHELGHNWGANHCTCSNNTMNSFITCANQFHSIFTIPEIVSFRDSRTCLDPGAACTQDSECNDSDVCTTDTCDAGTCSNTPIECTPSDACQEATCDPMSGCGNQPIECDDGNACTTDSCDTASGCVNDSIPDCCGNGTCESGEDCTWCSSDCIGGGGGCGDGICEGEGEDCFTCPQDCRCAGGGCAACCGDGVCAGPGEKASNCPVDCGGSVPTPACCGDGTCEGAENESNCAIDCVVFCTSDPECDDGDACNGLETCDSGSSVCVAGTPVGCVNDDGCCGAGCNSGNDSECSGCLPKSAGCSSNGDCCSNKCNNGTCRGN